MKPANPARYLPAQPAQLIGRARELLALRQLLLRDDVRLVTITGTPGIGKTRLAIATAASLNDDFPDGAVFVDLSTVFDPARVLVTIGKCLGLQELSPSNSFERIRQVVRDQSLLLVLDNFEQLLPAATDLASLLTASHWLKLLVTSRAPLRVRWEHVFEAPPLELPDLAYLPAPEQLGHVAAVALLLDRAEAAGSELRLIQSNAPAVAELCVRLDGLPLALELAAIQLRIISPEALLARMERRLDLLTGGARDQPERQRTLREAIGWSYRLLSGTERTLFQRLGVFVGGVSLDAARAILPSGASESELLASLAGLVDQNLLRRETLPDGESYFRMLETIQEYARERLAETEEPHLVEYQYAAYGCDLAESAEVELRRPDQIAWLNRLEREWPNLRAALSWCERSDQVELGVRLAAALGWFWYLRGGDRSEGRNWLEQFASRAASRPSATAARARALSAAGFLAQYQLDLAAALTLQETALALGKELQRRDIVAAALGRLAHLSLFRTEFERGDGLAAASYDEYRDLSDRWGMAFALGTRGLIARSQGRGEDATRYLIQSLGLFREQGDRWGTAHVLLGLGQVALQRGDDHHAEEFWEERLRLSWEIGNQTGVGHTLDLLATSARQRGDFARAAARFEEALVIRRKIGDRQAVAWVLQGMGELALAQADSRTAFAHLRESLRMRREFDDKPGIVVSLEAFARLATAEAQHRRSVRLAAASLALRAAIGPSLATQHYSRGVVSADPTSTNSLLARNRRALGRVDYDAAWLEGWALSLDEAVADALSGENARAPKTLDPNETTQPDSLTPREREVAALVARGLKNRQVAAELVMSEGTCHVHVVHILGKLGFHTRAQIAVWAARHGLIEPDAP